MNIRPQPSIGLFAAGLLLAAACIRVASAQIPPPPDGPPQEPAPYSAEQLDQLLGPIALYPDPLIALMLPASGSPDEIVAAANYLEVGGDPNGAGHEPWSDSVKGLAHYPAVVEWMAANMIWTQAVGEAFSTGPDGVMDSIQRLRGRALAVGALADTPQQQVVQEDGLIEILPAEPDMIYVPRYDPQVVYVGGYYGGPYMTFGEPYPAGVWLTFGFDWRRRSLWVGNGRFERDNRGWQRPDLVGATGHPWRPSEDHRVRGDRPVRSERPLERPNTTSGVFLPRPSGSSPDRFPPLGHQPGQVPAGFPAPAPRPRLPQQAGPPAASRSASPNAQPRPAVGPQLRNDARGAPAHPQPGPAAAPAKPAPATPAASHSNSSRSQPNDPRDRDPQQPQAR